MIATACVLVPLLAAAMLAVLPASWGARANLFAAAATSGLTACLPWATASEGGWLLADGLAVPLAASTGFVGLTTAWFNLGYVGAQAEGGQLVGVRLRLHHVLFQAVLGSVLLALLSDDLGLTWAALGAATAAGIVATGLPGTPETAEAAWRGLVPAWASAALALLGTVALSLAAGPVLGPGRAAMRWSGLADAAPGVSGAALNVAWAFLLVGYGGLAGLAPLHGWMPGLRAAGAAPVSAILSGLAPTAALAVLLRLRGVLAANAQALPPGPPLLALGLLGVLLAGFGLWRRRDAAGVVALCATGHRGLICLGFGLGTPAATVGGLLHLAAHTLAGAAVVQSAGGAGRQGSGLTPSHPASGAPFAAGLVALAGLPPFGVFTGGFLILTEAAREAPWLLLPTGAGVLAGAWALVSRLQEVWSGDHRAAIYGDAIHPAMGADANASPVGSVPSAWTGSPAQERSPAAGGAGEDQPFDAERRQAETRGSGTGQARLAWADGAPGRAALAGAWLNLAAALGLGVLLPAPLATWLYAAARALP